MITKIFNDKYKKNLLFQLNHEIKLYKYYSINLIFEILDKSIRKNPKEIITYIESNNATIKEWIHSQVGNIAGDLLESGKFHVYRGTLNETGQELLQIFDFSYAILFEMKVNSIDLAYIIHQKEIIRNNLKYIG